MDTDIGEAWARTRAALPDGWTVGLQELTREFAGALGAVLFG